MYTGKQGDTVEKGLPSRVVKSLTQEMKGKNFHVYFDNFFNSFDLLNDLVSDDIYACGTARSNRRGFPEALKKLSSQTGIYTYTYIVGLFVGCIYNS